MLSRSPKIQTFKQAAIRTKEEGKRLVVVGGAQSLQKVGHIGQGVCNRACKYGGIMINLIMMHSSKISTIFLYLYRILPMIFHSELR